MSMETDRRWIAFWITLILSERSWMVYVFTSDAISIRDILFIAMLCVLRTQSGELGLYDTISDAQPEGQGHSISIRDILLGFIWYYIGLNKYSWYPIVIIWYYIGFNKCSRYPIGIIWYYIRFNNIRDILLESYDTISDSISVRDILFIAMLCVLRTQGHGHPKKIELL